MKEEIVNYLLDNGFVYAGNNKFNKLTKRAVGEVIMNGEHKIQYETVKIQMEYIGESWEGTSEEDSNPLTQWKLYVNKEDLGDFLVHDLEEFQFYFGKK